MSREIKFRAWKMHNGKFQRYVFTPFAALNYGQEHPDAPIMRENTTNNIMDFMPDADIIEQYTGLEDKNDKEICEGDIVKWLDGLGEYIVFRVEWQDNRARFCLRNEYSVFDYEDLSDKKKPYIEVIGNIHEPPKEFRPEHLKRMGVSMSKGDEE